MNHCAQLASGPPGFFNGWCGPPEVAAICIAVIGFAVIGGFHREIYGDNQTND